MTQDDKEFVAYMVHRAPMAAWTDPNVQRLRQLHVAEPDVYDSIAQSARESSK